MSNRPSQSPFSMLIAYSRLLIAHSSRMAAVAALLATTWTPLSAQETTPQNLTQEPALDRDEARRLTTAAQPPPAAAGQPAIPPSRERQRQSSLREMLVPTSEPEAAIRVRALEGSLDIDEQNERIYGPGRTQILYGPYYLEADKVILDRRLSEIQAEGNVILRLGEDTIHADSLRYNFTDNEGVAFNLSGAHEPIYFSSDRRTDGPPQFHKVSREESIFRDVKVTTCDFAVPHYHIKGKEIILMEGDRIFFRGATFYVWNVPVFFLPVYSRSLVEASPWSTQLGYNSRTGLRIRETYTYHYQTEEPSLGDDTKYETRSRGRANVFADYLSRKGVGGGLDYDYSFGFGRQEGRMSIYGLSDSDRRVVGATVEPDAERFRETRRWQAEWLHRAPLTRDLTLLINVDEFSDPDIFYDVLDRFGDGQFQRERQVERRSRVALTYVREAYVARLMADVKHRIGLDRFNDFSNPRDDNFDFDLDPSRTLEDSDADGISSRRWGLVSEQLPHLTLATRHLPLGRRMPARQPVYYNAQLDLYRALDKGLNIVSSDDDDFVEGLEFYQQLLTQIRLSQRYILLARAGFGVGYAPRSETLDVSFPAGAAFPIAIDGLTFIDDRETFLVGRRERNLNQIEELYFWGDAELRFLARFSDALRGDVGWRYRATSDDFLGDFYASLGSTTFREDLYNYKIREHWVDANVEYRLARPLLRLWGSTAYNLTPKSELYSKEDMGYVRGGYEWSSQRLTYSNAGWAGVRRQQIFDPSDPAAFEETVLEGGWQLGYTPVHQRWYTYFRLSYRDSLNGNVETSDDPRKTFFSDERAQTGMRWTYGRELGPKWDMEYTIEWDEQVGGLREMALILQRDLHDAIGVLRVALRNDERRVDNSREQQANEVDVRLGIKFKLPDREVAIGSGDIRTLRDRTREPALAY